MKRREAIKSLCKAIGIAMVIPTALATIGKDSSFIVPFNEKYYIGYDPYEIDSYTRDMIVFKARRQGCSERVFEYIVSKYCNEWKTVIEIV